MLDDALERTGPVGRIVAFLGEELLRFVGQRETDVLLIEAFQQALQLDVDDAGDFFVGQSVENDRFVDAVEELRTEVSSQRFHHATVAFVDRQILHDELAADVGGHDDDRVLEIHRPALTVGDASVIKDLKKDVENIAVGFFHFVEKDDGIRMATDGFGQLSALIVSDIARRRADEPRHGVLLHVFAHVEAHDGLLVVEEEFGQRLAQLGFAHAGGSEEHEGTDRPVFVLQSGPRAAHGVGDRFDGLGLSDHALHEPLFHFDQLLTFTFLQARDRDAGPSGNHLGHVVFGHFFAQELPPALLGQLLVVRLELGGELRNLSVLDLARLGEIPLTLGQFELVFQILDLLGQLA